MSRQIEAGDLVAQVRISCRTGCPSDILGVPFIVKEIGHGKGVCGVCGEKDQYPQAYAIKEEWGDGYAFSVPVWALKRFDPPAAESSESTSLPALTEVTA